MDGLPENMITKAAAAADMRTLTNTAGCPVAQRLGP